MVAKGQSTTFGGGGALQGGGNRPSLPELDPRSGYNLAAPYYDQWKWQRVWWEFERPLIRQLLWGVRQCPRFSSILDVGVGTGTYLKWILEEFDPDHAAGVDISEGMLEVAEAKLCRFPQAFLQRADARLLPFEDASFDIVLLSRVATHIPDIEAAALEIFRVLRPGGSLIVSDLDPEHSYKCTRVPLSSAKISIQTFRHSMNEWHRALEPLDFSIGEQHKIVAKSVKSTARWTNLPSSICNSDRQALSFTFRAQRHA